MKGPIFVLGLVVIPYVLGPVLPGPAYAVAVIAWIFVSGMMGFVMKRIG